MGTSHAAAQAGSIGGLTTRVRARNPQDITAAARRANFQKYLDQVPEFVTDEAERIHRAELLRRADMIRLGMKSVKARKLRKQLAELEAELDDAAEA